MLQSLEEIITLRESKENKKFFLPTLEDLLLYFVNLKLGIKLRIIVIYLIRSWVKVDTKDGVLGT